MPFIIKQCGQDSGGPVIRDAEKEARIMASLVRRGENHGEPGTKQCGQDSGGPVIRDAEKEARIMASLVRRGEKATI